MAHGGGIYDVTAPVLIIIKANSAMVCLTRLGRPAARCGLGLALRPRWAALDAAGRLNNCNQRASALGLESTMAPGPPLLLADDGMWSPGPEMTKDTHGSRASTRVPVASAAAASSAADVSRDQYAPQTARGPRASTICTRNMNSVSSAPDHIEVLFPIQTVPVRYCGVQLRRWQLPARVAGPWTIPPRRSAVSYLRQLPSVAG